MSDCIILFIIDESGSMLEKEESVISGYNKVIEDQKRIEDDSCRIFTLTFNDRVKVLDNGSFLSSETVKFNRTNYLPEGRRALYDAVITGIIKVEERKCKNEKVFCVIMTDGIDNASKHWKLKEVKQYIKSYNSKDWKFLYIGENPEKWTEEVTDGFPFNHLCCSANFKTANRALSFYRRNTYY